MELWIRSQDRKNLIKVNALYTDIPEDFGKGSYGIYCDKRDNYISNNLLKIGEYKTKERTLEVLDEIQRILHPTVLMNAEINTGDNYWVENGIIYQKYKDNFDIQKLSTYVYEMPKE